MCTQLRSPNTADEANGPMAVGYAGYRVQTARSRVTSLVAVVAREESCDKAGTFCDKWAKSHCD